MKNAKAIMGILLIFALGVIVGGLGARMVYEERIEALVSGDSQARETAMVNRLSKRLDLDTKQREQVQAIIRDTRQEVAVIRQQLRPQIAAILEKSQGLIKQTLRPDQVAKYDMIIAERKDR